MLLLLQTLSYDYYEVVECYHRLMLLLLFQGRLLQQQPNALLEMVGYSVAGVAVEKGMKMTKTTTMTTTSASY